MTGDGWLFRTAGGVQQGTGHVMRCFALAQAWQAAGGEATFALASESPALEARLHAEGVKLARLPTAPGDADDAAEVAELARQLGASWVILDGYEFGPAYRRAIKQRGQRLLAIDDDGIAGRLDADAVLNQSLRADERLYPAREPETELLLGTPYALLRREFAPWAAWERQIPDLARHVLVTLGGSDADNATATVVRALEAAEVPGLEAVVVVGAASPHAAAIEAAARESAVPIRVERNTTRMAELMAWADVAVSAAGTTACELAFMGLPAVLLVLADNQVPVAEDSAAAGAAVNAGWARQRSLGEIAKAIGEVARDADARAAMARRGRTLVDGRGAIRVRTRLRARTLGLRRVGTDDAALLFGWANDPDVRAASFSSEPIPWDHHLRWLRTRLEDPACLFFVGMSEAGVPIGQVRYDVAGSRAVISTSIDRQFRSRGCGSALIWRASREVFQTTAVAAIDAYVKVGNEASLRAFQAASFEPAGTTTVREEPAVRLVLRKGVDQ